MAAFIPCDRNKCLCLIWGGGVGRPGTEGDLAWREGKWAIAPSGIRLAFHPLPEERDHMALSVTVGVSGLVFIDLREVYCTRHVIWRRGMWKENSRCIDRLILFNYCQSYNGVFHQTHAGEFSTSSHCLCEDILLLADWGVAFPRTFPIVIRHLLDYIVIHLDICACLLTHFIFSHDLLCCEPIGALSI